MADFNGDGKLDLAVVFVMDGIGTGRVRVYLGDGHGGFILTPGSPIAVGNNPWSIVTGDFNRDGKLDWAVCNDGAANQQPDSISVFLGDGNGGFTEGPGSPIPLPANTGPLSLKVADFNGDGKLDLISANLHNLTVSAFLGNGDGTFALAPGSPIAMPVQPWSVRVADFNGDGKADVVVLLDSGAAVLLGDGTGRFTFAPGSPLPNSPWGMTVGDFNGDGKPDLAMATNDTTNWPAVGSVTVFFGNGDGTFRSSNIAPTRIDEGVNTLAAGDFNLDGKADIAAITFDRMTAHALLGNGGSGFAFAPPFSIADLSAAVAVGDIDGDGTPDLAVSGGTISLNLSKPPLLTIAQSHAGNFTQGQVGMYSVVVANRTGAGPTRDTVTVTETVPNGLTLLWMAGAGWNCGISTCTRTDTLTNGLSYPPLSIAVSASLGAPLQVANLVTVSTSGAADASASDNTTINRLPQTVSFGAFPASTYGASAFPMTASATSGLTVTFASASPSVCTVSGNMVAIVGAGTCSLVASQAGSSIYAAAVPITQSFLVNKAALRVTADNKSIQFGAALGFTFSLAGLVNGDLPSVVSGNASFTTNATTTGGNPNAGSWTITVGAGTLSANNYTFSFAPGTLTVTKAGTFAALTEFARTLTATLTVIPPGGGTPTGTVQFLNGGKAFGTTTLVGSAARFPAVSGPITAVYSGDANFTGSTSNLVTVYDPCVSSLSMTSSASPSTLGQAVTFTATVETSGGPDWVPPVGGSVQFFDGSKLLGSGTVSRGQATFTTSALTGGWHSIGAQYSGDSVWPAASATYPQTVVAAVTMNVTSAPSVPVYGQLAVLTASVGAAAVPPGFAPPTGQVTFSVKGMGLFAQSAPLGTAMLTSGTATLTVNSLVVGPQIITAEYSGDATWSPTSRAITVTGSPAATSALVSLTLASGQMLLSGLVTPVSPGAGIPTGTMQFVDTSTNSIVASADLSHGKASVTVAAGTAPSLAGRPIAAMYSGDSNFKASASRPLPTLVNAAANSPGNIAADEIVSLFGIVGLQGDATAKTPLATSLGGVTVNTTDSAGVHRPAPLYGVFGSAGQINFIVPSNSAAGLAVVAVTLPDGGTITTVGNIAGTAPGIFTANMTGGGPYAGQQLYVHADGTQTGAESAVWSPGDGTFVPNPISLDAPGDQVYLVLYGTGIRHAGSLTATLNGVPVPTVYRGAHPSYSGLDQINLGPLPASLAGAGTVTLAISIDGQAANTVTLVIQ